MYLYMHWQTNSKYIWTRRGTVNKLLFAINLFYDLPVPEMNWIAATNYRDQALSKPFFFLIKIWEILVQYKKYLWQWSSRVPRENFLHAIKSWFTVYMCMYREHIPRLIASLLFSFSKHCPLQSYKNIEILCHTFIIMCQFDVEFNNETSNHSLALDTTV